MSVDEASNKEIVKEISFLVSFHVFFLLIVCFVVAGSVRKSDTKSFYAIMII